MNIHRLQFSIDIQADKRSIWHALWNDAMYRDWASVFFKGSYAVTDHWKEGSTVLFLSPDQSGIFSIIEKHVPHKTMEFKHLGKVENGKEQPLDEETEKWSGTTEMYTLNEKSTYTTLTVDIDILDEHLDFMKSTFPKALEKIKNNCARQ